ncbi:MAG: PH domain-containing protein [Pirellulales bacterium]|nr:PH domain-containing protein [Pirellulales bacterium]
MTTPDFNDDITMGKANQGPSDSPETASERLRQQMADTRSESDDADHEEDLWSGGYSSKAMFGTWFLMILVSIFLLVAPFLMPLTYPIALGVILAMWVIGGLVYAKRRFGVFYELTTQRFIHQTGILMRQTDRIEVIDIDDVSFTQGPIQRILGVGNIVLTSSDRSHPTLSMIGIADAKRVAGLIDDIRRQERRRRSVHIEAI